MNYPLISEYISAMESAEDNFATRVNLRPVITAEGVPYMSSGNFAVVFKMEDVGTGKFYAVKCFTKEQERREESYRLIAEELAKVESPYLASIEFLEKELFVDSANSDESEFPVLVMDWVEGKTLDAYLRENIDDEYELAMLAYRFCQMAKWLMEQPFAHGDLKPDNILVQADGSLVLVDYDGMYVPAMQGQKSRELGSPDYRHPSRTEDTFNEHIDDFSLISIALSLKAISLNAQLLSDFGEQDRLLFSEQDYVDVYNSKVFTRLGELCSDKDLKTFRASLVYAALQEDLSLMSSSIFNISEPELENLSTEVSEEDLANAWVDEYGVMYSQDKKRLLHGSNLSTSIYQIQESTKVICSNAFKGCETLKTITLPQGLSSIGNKAFYYCTTIKKVILPASLKSIGVATFKGCWSLVEVNIPNNVNELKAQVFSDCPCLETVILPNSLSVIGPYAFGKYLSFEECCGVDEITAYYRSIRNVGLKSIILPDNLTYIGEGAFARSGLTSIKLPDVIKTISEKAFLGCRNLERVVFPQSLNTIQSYAFAGCESLLHINLNKGIETIEGGAFYGCRSLITVNLPEGIKSLGNGSFSGCSKLKEISIPNSIIAMDYYTFNEPYSLDGYPYYETAYTELSAIYVKSQNAKIKVMNLLPEVYHKVIKVR